MKLSILIPTIPNRVASYFPSLVRELHRQIIECGRDDVEVIGLYDNKRRKVGEKRNELLKLAQADYLVFIDDDDRIGDCYVAEIVAAIDANYDADVIVFDCITTINGDISNPTYSKYSLSYDGPYPSRQEGNQWSGKPAHTMVWRAAIAKAHKFPDENYGEDIDWVWRAAKDAKKEVRIDKVLYYYDFDSSISETRG